jgi:hypothetical protein
MAIGLRASDPTAMPKKTSPRPPPTRGAVNEDARQTLAMLRGCSQTVNVVLVAFTDGVEIEIWADGSLRRRSRFLRDSEARKYCERLSVRLQRRGYHKEAEVH